MLVYELVTSRVTSACFSIRSFNASFTLGSSNFESSDTARRRRWMGSVEDFAIASSQVAFSLPPACATACQPGARRPGTAH